MNYQEKWDESIKLRNLGKSYSIISKNLNVPRDTIIGWLLYNKKPNRPRNQELLPTSTKLTTSLAYILGVMNGDGFIRNINNTSVIALAAKDFDFCKVFKNTLEIWSGIKCSKIKKRNDNLWEVALSSRKAGSCIKNFNLPQLFNSSDTIKCTFLRGLYDSEGSVNSSGYTKKVQLYNTNLNLMKLSKRLLKDIGIKSSIYKQTKNPSHKGNKTVFILQVGNGKNIKTFYEKVGFLIKRKQEKLQKLLSSYKYNKFR